MKCEIRRVRNGAALRIEPDGWEAKAEELVYQERETDEIEAFADFLSLLLDHYGPNTTRYSPTRIDSADTELHPIASRIPIGRGSGKLDAEA